MSEKTDKMAGEISNKGSLLAVLRGLTEHPGWAIYSGMLQDQQDIRKGEVLLKPLPSTEAVYAQEFMKGEISGLSLAQISLFAHIEQLRSDVQVSEAKLERENELEKERTTRGSESRVDGDAFGGGSKS